MKLDIITPEKVFFSAQADMVVVPGVEGDFGVLTGHAPFISAIRPGIITIDLEGGKQKRLAVAGGFSEVVPERCTVLAELAVDCDTVNASEVLARLDQAKQELAAADSDSARQLAEKKLALAEVLHSVAA